MCLCCVELYTKLQAVSQSVSGCLTKFSISVGEAKRRKARKHLRNRSHAVVIIALLLLLLVIIARVVK